MTNFADQLYVRLTDEPVFVLRQFKRITLVRRPQMTQDGIRYKFGLFFNAELETLEEQTARTMAMINARNGIAGLAVQAEQAEEELPFAALAAQFKKSN